MVEAPYICNEDPNQTTSLRFTKFFIKMSMEVIINASKDSIGNDDHHHHASLPHPAAHRQQAQRHQGEHIGWGPRGKHPFYIKT